MSRALARRLDRLERGPGKVSPARMNEVLDYCLQHPKETLEEIRRHPARPGSLEAELDAEWIELSQDSELDRFFSGEA